MSKLFPKCSRCQTTHFVAFIKHALWVCSKCGYHFRLDARTRIASLCDKKSFKSFNDHIKSIDPLKFPNYEAKLRQSVTATRMNEAIVTGTGTIKGFTTTIAVMEPNFIMASMGSVVGEKVTRMLEYAMDNHLPAIIVISSGGARMQEGILSLRKHAMLEMVVERKQLKNTLATLLKIHSKRAYRS